MFLVVAVEITKNSIASSANDLIPGQVRRIILSKVNSNRSWENDSYWSTHSCSCSNSSSSQSILIRIWRDCFKNDSSKILDEFNDDWISWELTIQ